MVSLSQIFQGSNKLHWQAFECLWNIPHGQQSSITSITVTWLCVVVSVAVSLFLSVNSIWPLSDIMIRLLLFISKKCCDNQVWYLKRRAFPPEGNPVQHLSHCEWCFFAVWFQPTDCLSWQLNSFEADCMVQNEALHSVRCHTPTVLTNMLCGPWCAHNI